MFAGGGVPDSGLLVRKHIYTSVVAERSKQLVNINQHCRSRLLGQVIRWQRVNMENQEKNAPRLAGGIFIAIGMLGGAIVGVIVDQPSAGMVIGLGLGVAAATVTWLIDSKRG